MQKYRSKILILPCISLDNSVSVLIGKSENEAVISITYKKERVVNALQSQQRLPLSWLSAG